jgi:hypothetical protein
VLTGGTIGWLNHSGQFNDLASGVSLQSSGSPVTWSHRLPEKELAAESKLLPATLALRADVVCVAEHPPFSLWLVLASGASHPWIELQRHYIASDQEPKNQNYFRHGVTPSVRVEQH